MKRMPLQPFFGYAWIVGAVLMLSGAVQERELVPSSADDETPSGSIACGPASLAAWFRLEGHTVTLDEINSSLPSKGKHSLAELRDTARRFGFSLRGERIGLDNWPLDRPALTHLNRNGAGHFVVVRPVGHTGKLVQVLDHVSDVQVVDASKLLSSSEWTGAALVPFRYRDWISARSAVFFGALLCSSAGLFFLNWLVCALRRRHLDARASGAQV
jgi:Peptidase C39 family